MIREEWHVVVDERRFRGHEIAEVRPWAPGDGLSCRWAAANRRFPCGAPVAKARTTVTEPDYRFTGRDKVESKTFVLCSRHLAEWARRGAGIKEKYEPSALVRNEKEATEYLIQKHWDEYQEFLAQRRRETTDELLSLLPESLREAVRTADEEEATS
jgi:hypothetical protein